MNTPVLSRAAVNTVLAVFAAYTLLPLTWLVIAATKDTGDLFTTGGFTFAKFHLLDNLHMLLTADNGIYLRWFANTIAYAGVGAIFSSLFALAAGYAFDKFSFPLKEKLFGLVLVGVLVPSAVTAMPLYLMASKIGLVNTFWGVFLPGVVNPFGVYLGRMFSAAFVPGEMLEAARIDGAGEFRAFIRVALPVLRPAFATLFLFAFTYGWNSFFLPFLMLSDHHLYPLGLGLFTWNSRVGGEPELYTVVITGSLVTILPLIVAFLSLQRHWKAGLTSGALK